MKREEGHKLKRSKYRLKDPVRLASPEPELGSWDS